MKTKAEIRMKGMQALINALGLLEAERFVMSISQDRFDYTEWRQHNLESMPIDKLAQAANFMSEKIQKTMTS